MHSSPSISVHTLNHVEAVERTLRRCGFTHSLHTGINLPDQVKDDESLLGPFYWADLEDQEYLDRLRRGVNFFGLTFGAHTREAYQRLPEGWVTTPHKEMPTDLYMWQKLLAVCENDCRTTRQITALNFPHFFRKTMSEQEREAELKSYFAKIQEQAFHLKLEQLTRKYCPAGFQGFKIPLFRKILGFFGKA